MMIISYKCNRCGDVLEQEIISSEDDTGKITTRCPFGHSNHFDGNRCIVALDLNQEFPEHDLCPWSMHFLHEIDQHKQYIDPLLFTEFRSTVLRYLKTYQHPNAGSRKMVIAIMKWLQEIKKGFLPIRWFEKAQANQTIKNLCDYDVGWSAGAFFFPPDYVADYMVFAYFDKGDEVLAGANIRFQFPEKQLCVWVSASGHSTLYMIPLVKKIKLDDYILLEPKDHHVPAYPDSLHLLTALNQDLFDDGRILRKEKPISIEIIDLDKPFDSKQILIERHHRNLSNQERDDDSNPSKPS